jgi:uncharacterized protein (TIGR03084 family)
MAPTDMTSICEDLAAEHAALDELVADLGEEQWDLPTPAPGWMVRDQISHLAYFDGTATTAAVDAEAFAHDTEQMMAAENPMADALALGRDVTGAELLEIWRQRRRRMLDVFAGLDPSTRLPWYGPPMSAMSFATARLMETWAHGQDVRDTLGVEPLATERLRHVAHIGVRARPFSYATNDREAPPGDVYVELVAPSGETWAWGDPASSDRVTGPALDFCLVVTQRRHPSDVDLDVRGPLAADWIGIAQAFAGPPGEGRTAGQFA